jgi:hypothetical protein
MINSVTVTNHLGDSVTLELRFPEKSGFLISEGGITGLEPPKANINITEVSTMDGAIYNSSRANSRNIVFNLGFFENPAANLTIENIRHNSYKYFPVKRPIEILVETDTRSCRTIGYVESNEINVFSEKEGSVISVICPDAYLYSVDDQITVFSAVNSIFEFPFSNESLTEKLLIISELEVHSSNSVYYLGDASIGVRLVMHAIGDATNVKIVNVSTREEMSIDSAHLVSMTGFDIHEGDDIIISTVKGNKYVSLFRDGLEVNILNALGKNPVWFQLEKGDNLFTYTADEGATNLQFRIESQIAYEGV